MDEKSAGYQKQETNLDHYKREILECCMWNLAVVKGIPKLCHKTDCDDCDFKSSLERCHKGVLNWLKQPHIKPNYELTQFEYDLLQSFSRGHLSRYELKNIVTLNWMKEKGYFKGVDENETIEDILANCDISEED